MNPTPGTPSSQSEDFDKIWRSDAAEREYNHWTAGEPRNQVQLAFRRHWILFREIISQAPTGNRVLELGCGRGSISAYFSEAGYDCTLLDLSPEAVQVAERVFDRNGLKGTFVEGDATATGFPDASFDVVVSIGLLEHLEDLRGALAEQVRLLRPNGVLLAYVVPDRPENVQKQYGFVCDILALYDEALHGPRTSVAKPDLYRSDAGSQLYLELLATMPMTGVQASGVYPLPMISPSPSFPFTLMPPAMEDALVRHFQQVLIEREATYGRNPWLCDEEFGQAFLVWGRKTE